jgi:hypothetical protein
MRNLRFNIASILGVILFLAVGFAALRESNDYWDSGLFTLTLGVLLVSVLLSVHRSQAKRAFWIGFALFGWGYLGLSLVPSIESRQLTTKGLAYLDSILPGRTLRVSNLVLTGTASGGSGSQIQSVAFTIDGTKLATSNRGVVRIWDAATGRLLSGWGGTTENFIRIGHSLLALVAAWLSGHVSRRLSRGARLQPLSTASSAEG